MDVFAHPVVSGRVIDLGAFAWLCASSFGFLQEMAPPASKPQIVDDRPDPEERWSEAARELARIRTMSIANAAVEQAQETIEAWRGWSTMEVGRVLALSRVERMQSLIDAWDVPHKPMSDLRARMVASLSLARQNLVAVPRPVTEQPSVQVWLSDRLQVQEAETSAAFAALLEHRASEDLRDQIRAGLEMRFGDPPALAPVPGETLTPNGFPLTREGGYV